MRNKGIMAYFGLLFISLALLYYPSFHYPPRSDWWSTAYFFHRIDALSGGGGKWMHILQYDPWNHGRFQPLGYIILYFEKALFGSGFSYFYIFNFALYCVSIILLYKLAMNFCRDRFLAASFLALFAFLFSHFDIISWSFHSYIISGFCVSILGFISYIRFLRSGKPLFAVFSAVLFLGGMLCYETFFLWPLTIIILTHTPSLYAGGPSAKRERPLRRYLPVIAAAYSSYFAVFLLLGASRVYRDPFLYIPLASIFSLRNILFSILAVCFNMLYNGILINLAPFLACPLVVNENIGLGGALTGFSPHFLGVALLFSGGLLIGVSVWAARRLLKKGEHESLKIIGFFLFLLFCASFILFHCRTLTNSAVFNFTQFRYLYVQNAFIVLMAAYAADRFLSRSRRARTITYSFLVIVLMFNIYATHSCGLPVLNRGLAPLKKIFSDIRAGIREERISGDRKLFISDDIARRLPSLCWNREMGECCMRGTYQWAFCDEEIEYFSSLEDAAWIIDENKLNIAAKDR